MPYVISREEALLQIEKQIPRGECLICHLVEKREEFILHKGIYTTVVLSLYPRTWGQIMVMSDKHITSFNELDTAAWSEMTELLLKATKAAESVLRPLRCYVAATGSLSNYPMTSPHLHFNIIPIYAESDKPSTIFTWEQGISAGSESEWEELYRSLKGEFE